MPTPPICVRSAHAQDKRYRQDADEADAPTENGKRERIGAAGKIASDGGRCSAKRARDNRQQDSKCLPHPASRSDLFDYTTIPIVTVFATTWEVVVPPAFDLVICGFRALE